MFDERSRSHASFACSISREGAARYVRASFRRFREQREAGEAGHPCARCRWLPKHYLVQPKLPLTDAWWPPAFADEPGPPPSTVR
ncbi:MAG: hypothetical protein QM765_43725 [Myxococcales bacterium]